MSRLRVLLLLSLLVNLFGIGVIAGGAVVFWSRNSLPFGPTLHRRLVARPLFEAGAGLPPSDRARFVAALRAASLADRPLNRDGIQARRAAAVLFAAPEFDRAAVAALLARSREDDFALRQRLEDAALDFAATLPPEERADLARGLAQGGPLRHPKR